MSTLTPISVVEQPLLLDIKNVSVRREFFDNTITVFNNLNLQIKQNESLAVIGANGSGKSSLLGLLQGELRAIVQAGSHLKILGKTAVNIWEFKKQIGIVSHQLQNTYRDDVKGDDILLSGYYASIGVWKHQSYTNAQRYNIGHIAKSLGIEHLMNRYFCQLSTGEKRRFILGRALIHNPSTLIFDEPTSGLDIAARHHYKQLMNQLLDSGKNLIVVTHHIEEIPPAIKRIVIMKDNAVFADGNKADLLTADILSHAFGIDVNINEEQGHFTLRV